jgi:iron-sulfur cluster assembly protein
MIANIVTITPKAAEKIKALTVDDPQKGLRIKVVGGGCSGLHYKMEIDMATERDKVFQDNDAKAIIDKKTFLYIAGSEIDYVEALSGAGFKIQNPIAKRTCGCGESFNV